MELKKYVNILRQWKIAHKSVILTYDTLTNTKKCIHPFGWQKNTFENSTYEPNKNALIQNTGNISNIIVVDVDGIDHPTNKLIIDICMKYCKFFNKTKKGYHFFFQYTDIFSKSQSIKYINDSTNTGSQSAPGLASAPGLDLKSNGGCVYYGSYYIGDSIIKYENQMATDIVPIPTILIKELQQLFDKSNVNINKQRKTPKYPHTITNSTHDFPNTTVIDIDTLNKLIACFPPSYFTNYDDWIAICFLIKHTNHTEPAFQIFYKYSKSID